MLWENRVVIAKNHTILLLLIGKRKRKGGPFSHHSLTKCHKEMPATPNELVLSPEGGRGKKKGGLRKGRRNN